MALVMLHLANLGYMAVSRDDNLVYGCCAEFTFLLVETERKSSKSKSLGRASRLWGCQQLFVHGDSCRGVRARCGQGTGHVEADPAGAMDGQPWGEEWHATCRPQAL